MRTHTLCTPLIHEASLLVLPPTSPPDVTVRVCVWRSWRGTPTTTTSSSQSHVSSWRVWHVMRVHTHVHDATQVYVGQHTGVCRPHTAVARVPCVDACPLPASCLCPLLWSSPLFARAAHTPDHPRPHRRPHREGVGHAGAGGPGDAQAGHGA